MGELVQFPEDRRSGADRRARSGRVAGGKGGSCVVSVTERARMERHGLDAQAEILQAQGIVRNIADAVVVQLAEVHRHLGNARTAAREHTAATSRMAFVALSPTMLSGTGGEAA